MKRITSPNGSTENTHLFLLAITVEGCNLEMRIDNDDQTFNVTFDKIQGKDLLAVNNKIKNFLEINSPVSLHFSKKGIRLMNLRGIKAEEH